MFDYLDYQTFFSVTDTLLKNNQILFSFSLSYKKLTKITFDLLFCVFDDPDESSFYFWPFTVKTIEKEKEVELLKVEMI